MLGALENQKELEAATEIQACQDLTTEISELNSLNKE